MLVNYIPDIYTYAMLTAAVSFMVYFVLRLKKENIPLWNLILSSFLTIILALFGARLMWCLEVPDLTLSQVFSIDFSGFRLLGGVIFILLSIVLMAIYYKKKYNVSADKVLSVGLESALITATLSKFACFLNGCCYGIPTDLPWGMVFPYDNLGVPRHPTQIYETSALLANFAIIFALRNKLSTSQKYSLAIFIYVVTRMMIEPLREEASLFIDGPTRPMYYALLVICILIIFKDNIISLFKKDKQKK